jgi:hypothetical protein
MVRTERVAIEKHTEKRILECPMRPAFSRTRVVSPRQLPTDHDYAVSTREYQSDQPSQKLLDRYPLSSFKRQTTMKPTPNLSSS